MTRHPRPLLWLASALGCTALIGVWLGVKYGLGVSDRYLPRPEAVLRAFDEIEPSILAHTGATCLRLAVGLVVGTLVGVGAALAMSRSEIIERLLLPPIHSLRAVPPIASIPFFLLWFGFAESGKVVLVLLGVGLNIAVAAHQLLTDIHPKYSVAFRSFGHSLSEYPWRVSLPLILDGLLPTLRASVSIAFGVVIVSELLGSQVGLGYLIQTSRTTYSIHVIFLVTGVLGVLSVVSDRLVVLAWSRLLFWRRIGGGSR